MSKGGRGEGGVGFQYPGLASPFSLNMCMISLGRCVSRSPRGQAMLDTEHALRRRVGKGENMSSKSGAWDRMIEATEGNYRGLNGLGGGHALTSMRRYSNNHDQHYPVHFQDRSWLHSP